MKLAMPKICLSAFALVVCLGPNVGWSTRAYGASVTGQVTATPLDGAVEIDHRVYHVLPNSAAETALQEISAGLTVDIVLDGPAGSSGTHVVSIMRHPGT